MPAGIAAAISSVECQRRNIRSMKFITVQEAVETTSGNRQPEHVASAAGRAHQLVAACQRLHRVLRQIASLHHGCRQQQPSGQARQSPRRTCSAVFSASNSTRKCRTPRLRSAGTASARFSASA